ncbi:hypothetical protein L1887_50286 [Cichorium endivia]|nr:hypothetical protein L1887_50286 [Cichorium endivia]
MYTCSFDSNRGGLPSEGEVLVAHHGAGECDTDREDGDGEQQLGLVERALEDVELARGADARGERVEPIRVDGGGAFEQCRPRSNRLDACSGENVVDDPLWIFRDHGRVRDVVLLHLGLARLTHRSARIQQPTRNRHDRLLIRRDQQILERNSKLGRRGRKRLHAAATVQERLHIRQRKHTLTLRTRVARKAAKVARESAPGCRNRTLLLRRWRIRLLVQLDRNDARRHTLVRIAHGVGGRHPVLHHVRAHRLRRIDLVQLQLVQHAARDGVDEVEVRLVARACRRDDELRVRVEVLVKRRAVAEHASERRNRILARRLHHLHHLLARRHTPRPHLLGLVHAAHALLHRIPDKVDRRTGRSRRLLHRKVVAARQRLEALRYGERVRIDVEVVVLVDKSERLLPLDGVLDRLRKQERVAALAHKHVLTRRRIVEELACERVELEHARAVQAGLELDLCDDREERALSVGRELAHGLHELDADVRLVLALAIAVSDERLFPHDRVLGEGVERIHLTLGGGDDDELAEAKRIAEEAGRGVGRGDARCQRRGLLLLVGPLTCGLVALLDHGRRCGCRRARRGRLAQTELLEAAVRSGGEARGKCDGVLRQVLERDDVSDDASDEALVVETGGAAGDVGELLLREVDKGGVGGLGEALLDDPLVLVFEQHAYGAARGDEHGARGELVLADLARLEGGGVYVAVQVVVPLEGESADLTLAAVVCIGPEEVEVEQMLGAGEEDALEVGASLSVISAGVDGIVRVLLKLPEAGELGVGRDLEHLCEAVGATCDEETLVGKARVDETGEGGLWAFGIDDLGLGEALARGVERGGTDGAVLVEPSDPGAWVSSGRQVGQRVPGDDDDVSGGAEARRDVVSCEELSVVCGQRGDGEGAVRGAGVAHERDDVDLVLVSNHANERAARNVVFGLPLPHLLPVGTVESADCLGVGDDDDIGRPLCCGAFGEEGSVGGWEAGHGQQTVGDAVQLGLPDEIAGECVVDAHIGAAVARDGECDLAELLVEQHLVVLFKDLAPDDGAVARVEGAYGVGLGGDKDGSLSLVLDVCIGLDDAVEARCEVRGGRVVGGERHADARDVPVDDARLGLGKGGDAVGAEEEREQRGEQGSWRPAAEATPCG